MCHFSVPNKNIQWWMAAFREVNFDSAKVQQAGHRDRNKVSQGRKLGYPQDVDQQILAWVLSMREKHLAVSKQML